MRNLHLRRSGHTGNRVPEIPYPDGAVPENSLHKLKGGVLSHVGMLGRTKREKTKASLCQGNVAGGTEKSGMGHLSQEELDEGPPCLAVRLTRSVPTSTGQEVRPSSTRVEGKVTQQERPLLPRN